MKSPRSVDWHSSHDVDIVTVDGRPVQPKGRGFGGDASLRSPLATTGRGFMGGGLRFVGGRVALWAVASMAFDEPFQRAMSENMKLSLTTFLVHDYDEAIAFFVGKLGFVLQEDTPLTNEKRWVVVKPTAESEAGLLLARVVDDEQRAAVGNQAGGRVAFFLTTDDFEVTYRQMRERGVRFCEEPREEAYGTVAVFVDLYGNRWDLLQE